MDNLQKNTAKKPGKKRKIINIVTAVVLIAVSFLCGFFTQVLIKGREDKALSEIVSYLKEYGVFDSETLELRELTTEEIAEILLGNLPDGYATYYTPEEYEKMQKNGDGDYAGLGVTVASDGKTLTVRSVITNSPAYHKGLKTGDVIIKGEYNGKEKNFSTTEDLSDFLSEVPDSTEFTLHYSRNGEGRSVAISKEQFIATYVCYKDSGITANFLSENYGDKPTLTAVENDNAEFSSDVGYVSLSSFEGDAAEEIGKAIKYMEDRGRSKLIFDLRNNGGGYMDVLCKVASYFIDNGGKNSSPVAYTKDNKDNFTVFYSSGNKTSDKIESISVIANEYTASASECLIGAMLYYKDKFDVSRLVIENTLSDGAAHTFGKGIMQTTYKLSNGGGLKLTTAIVYQPDKSTCIHGTGIVVSGDNAVNLSDGAAISRANALLG